MPSLRFSFSPRLWASLKGYRRDDFTADLGSGVTVALVALPLAIAFGIASGVRPDQGIVAAIVGGFIVSLLGGSKVQIAGPAGAFVAMLYGITEKYGVANLLIATMMAGVMLFALGAFRLGTLIRFIPVAIVIGFTTGIAAIIALSQVPDLLGLTTGKMPSNFFSQVAVLGASLHTVNWLALTIALLCLLLILLWPAPQSAKVGNWRFLTAKLPSTVVALALAAFAVWALALRVETISTRFGELPRGLPAPALPNFDWATAQNLLGPAIAIALLGAIESLLCARVADGLIGDRHDPNQELMAQGLANVASPLFGGIAVTGTIARTMTNVKSGARSPVAGIVHSVTLLVVILALAPLAGHIPLAALAAVLLWVAFNMVPWRELRELRRFSMFYRSILLSTLLLTVIFDLTVAIEVGLVMSSLFFIYRISSLTRVEPRDLGAGARLPDGRTLGVWELFGSFFFGSVTKLEALADPSRALPDIVILEMHKVINIDTTALDALEALHASLKRRGGRLILADLNEQPLGLLKRSGAIDDIGADNILPSLDAAMQAAARG
ncbi:MAG: SulP family inorganic anion transporter [Pseudomonadota bacterium]|nr:SulP family inorganic anion transporter [Pseudomonadota bacterium]